MVAVRAVLPLIFSDIVCLYQHESVFNIDQATHTYHPSLGNLWV